MPKLKINDQGVLVDAETDEPLEGDAAVEIEGLADLLKEAKAAAGLRKDISEQRKKKGAAVGDNSELQKHLDETKHELEEAEAKIERLAPFEKQVEKLTRDLEKATATASKHDGLRRQEMMRNAIIKAAVAAGFEDPDDALLRLEKAVKFTPRLADGKPTDDLDLSFGLSVEDEDGKASVQDLDVEKAVAWIAKKRPALVAGDASGGPRRGIQQTPRAPGTLGELKRAAEDAEARGDMALSLRLKNQFEDAKRGVGQPLRVG